MVRKSPAEFVHATDEETGAPGVLPVQRLRQLIDSGIISATKPLANDQLQPNSLDLRIGHIAYRARYSFLAVNTPVRSLLDELTLQAVDLTDPGGALLETGKVYIIPLLESVALPADLFGMANPKSSTGRLDVLARLLTDRADMFDAIPAGYQGPLYLEIVPRAFPIRVREGDSLAQIRIANRSAALLSDEDLRSEIAEHELILSETGVPLAADSLAIEDGVFLTVCVAETPTNGRNTIGFQALRSTPAVDLRSRTHPAAHYWLPLPTPQHSSDRLILQPNEFYIFSSKQRVVIPPHLCAEMVPYDAKSGELRTHYAGFFDSGFGMSAPGHPRGARVVLEVRNLDVPFMIQDGQRLFRLRYFRNSSRPDSLYGQDLSSNYQGQGLRLSKHFTTRLPPER